MIGEDPRSIDDFFLSGAHIECRDLLIIYYLAQVIECRDLLRWYK